MITRVKQSTFSTVDNFGYVSVATLGPANSDITVALMVELTAGRMIFIPAGTWQITAITLPVGSVIVGTGPKSILKLKDVTNVTAITVTSDCVLENFTLDGNKVNQVGAGINCFTIDTATNVKLKNVKALNPKASGFYISGASYEVALIECVATGFADSGCKAVRGDNLSLLGFKAYNSDAVATGDGIAIAPVGTFMVAIAISDAMCRNNVGRGISVVGAGGRNAVAVSIDNPRCTNNTSHGIHFLNAEGCTVTGGVTAVNGGDGVRIEGDVQNCRVTVHNARSNVGFGIREIIAGSTPNFNGLIYNITALNTASNVITKVGASSYIV